MSHLQLLIRFATKIYRRHPFCDLQAVIKLKNVKPFICPEAKLCANERPIYMCRAATHRYGHSLALLYLATWFESQFFLVPTLKVHCNSSDTVKRMIILVSPLRRWCVEAFYSKTEDKVLLLIVLISSLRISEIYIFVYKFSCKSTANW